MYANLSKKEKQKKLAQSRKRAVIWSVQEQRKRNLRTTQSQGRLLTSTTRPSPSQEVETFFPAQSDTTPLRTHTEDIPLPLHYANIADPTVAALTATIQDLTKQRRELDITIQVLTRRLQDILNKKPPAQARR